MATCNFIPRSVELKRQQFLKGWDSILRRIPFVKSIYSGVKQVSDTLFSDSGQAFRKALLIEFPGPGSYTIAFMTGTPSGELVATLSQSPRRHSSQGLGSDLPAHLRVAADALDELDRDLAHAQPEPQAARHHVGLEHVARALHRIQVDGLEGRPAEQPVARRGVAHVHPQQHPDVEVPSAREQLSPERPVHDTATRDPPRADHEVGVAQGVEQQVELLGLVGPVGVHLADHVVPLVERDPEPVLVRRPEAALLGAVQDLDGVVARGQLVGDLAGAVGRVVVDDQHPPRIGQVGEDRGDDLLEVAGLVVGRQDHPGVRPSAGGLLHGRAG